LLRSARIYVLALEVVNAQTGDVLARAQTEALNDLCPLAPVVGALFESFPGAAIGERAVIFGHVLATWKLGEALR
jgi:hypothetical protein